MNLLVTGANGFIGRALVQRLVERGHRVVAFDRVPFELPGALCLAGDISSGQAREEALSESKPDVILHLAYMKDISGQQPRETALVNVTAFQGLLDSCREHRVERVVWASSVMVYGLAHHYQPPVDERSPRIPETFYGACKTFDEVLSERYQQVYGMEIAALRPTTVFGPGRPPGGATPYARDVFYAALKGEPADLPQLEAEVNMQYVPDCVQAFVLAAEAKGRLSGAYNVPGFRVSMADLASAVKAAVPGFKVNFGSVAPPCWVSDLNGERAAASFGYRPEFGLREAVDHYLDFIRQELKGSAALVPGNRAPHPV